MGLSIEQFALKNITAKKDKKHAKATRRAGGIVYVLLRFAFLLAMSYVVLFPIMFMISNAVRNGTDSVDPTIIWIPKHFTLLNFKLAFDLLNFKESALLSAINSVGSAVFQVISASVVGYGFARFRFKGKKILFACVLFTVIIPQQVLLMPTYLQYQFFDFFGVGRIVEAFGYKGTVSLLNTPLTFLLPALLGVGLKGGLFIYIFRQFYMNMPRDLENAAKIDGCGPFRTYFSVMMPNSAVTGLTVFLFSIVWHWNEIFYSSMFFSKTSPLAPQLSAMRERVFRAMQSNPNGFADAGGIESVVQASALLSVIPLLILYLFCQKYFIQGVERSGIVE